MVSSVATKNIDLVMYMVKTACGKWRRHQNQLQPRFLDFSSDSRNTNNNPESISEQTSIQTSNDNANNNIHVSSCST